MMEGHLRTLESKEELVRKRYDELLQSGADLRGEGEQRLDAAIVELEEAYDRAKERFGEKNGQGD